MYNIQYSIDSATKGEILNYYDKEKNHVHLQY